MSYQQNPPYHPGQPPYGQYQQQPPYPHYAPPNWQPNQQPTNPTWEAYPNQGHEAPQGYPQQNYAPPPFPPPQQSQYPPDQKYQPAPSPPRQPLFRWSSPSSSTLNTTVRDPDGQEIFTITTPKKKETIISSSSGQIAKLEWSSTPTISLHGAKSVKIKEWIPFDKRAGCRSLNVQGDSYRLADQNGSVLIFKNNYPTHVGVISDPNDTIHLELAPEVLPLLEEFVIIATILQSGHDIEKSGWFSGPAFQMGAIGGVGGAVASF